MKYGISNLTVMGGLPSASSFSTLGRPKWALIRNSLPPWNRTQQNISVQNHYNMISVWLLISYRERLDCPHHQILLWHIFSTACTGFELRWVGITRDRDPYLHIICHRLFFKLSLCLKIQHNITGYLVKGSFLVLLARAASCCHVQWLILRGL